MVWALVCGWISDMLSCIVREGEKEKKGKRQQRILGGRPIHGVRIYRKKIVRYVTHSTFAFVLLSDARR